ncbi:MAG: family 1 glycosylhydrolase [Patescibacteria group bacterium]|nr:family 1 glycosylhydrolase [Patescibacteria group bacterium]
MKKFFPRKKKILLIGVIIFVILFCTCFSNLSINSYKYNKPVGHEESTEEFLKFPDGFLWGAATASYQVEGGNKYSSWWEFEQEKGRIKNGDRTDVCVDHYNLYEEDFDLLKEMELNSYRFSLEWGRIEPEKGVFDDTEIVHYKNVLQALKERNITPMVTLWHHSIPTWFAEEGGWENKDSIKYFSAYVQYVAENLGDDTELWLTMNEPTAYISSGYLMGKWPPGEADIKKVPVLQKNLVKAHKVAFEIIHKYDSDAEVGIAEYSSYVVSDSNKNVIENIVAYSIDKSWTHYFVSRVKDELDYIGVHYYYRQKIRLGLLGDLISKDAEDFEETGLDREYYPRGLYEVLMRFDKYDLPIYITEIGVQDYHEVSRDVFIKEHAKEVYYAIQNGVDVRGFHYWALLDSFEWSEGYDAKFGLIAVDLDTLERTIKDESWEYAEIAKCNCVSTGN